MGQNHSAIGIGKLYETGLEPTPAACLREVFVGGHTGDTKQAAVLVCAQVPRLQSQDDYGEGNGTGRVQRRRTCNNAGRAAQRESQVGKSS